MSANKKNIIVFDLDGTLIQSTQFAILKDWDFSVNLYWNNVPAPNGVGIKLRPQVHELLKILSTEYHLAIYTHSYFEAADLILRRADLSHFFSCIFSNSDEVDGVKDLTKVLAWFGYDPQADLDNIMIIDDNKWCMQPQNLMQIPSYSSENDQLFDQTFPDQIKNFFNRLQNKGENTL